MSVEIKVPGGSESVTEAIIAVWTKNVGDYIEKDEIIVELETDKVTLEVRSPAAGVVTELLAEVDETVTIDQVIAIVDDAASKPAGGEAAAAPVEAPAAEGQTGSDRALSPAVQRLVEEHGVNPANVAATGPRGHILKGDVLAHVASGAQAAPAAASKPAAQAPAPAPVVAGAEPTERVRMTKLRQTIASRLVEAQHNAAMLTTFNEVDMSAVMALRNTYKDAYQEKYGTKLGFTSFFVKAVIEALKAYPAVNAEIDGNEIIYKNFYHVGIAVGGGRGLVVPVVRHADQRGFADIELEVRRLAGLARQNKLQLDDLQGGTFTITNGGVYGSMLSTPILNPPQSGILGLHNIVERPVVVDGQVVVRPIMYVALTYDHRIIDGREAVSFLVRVKECIEHPERMLLEI